LGLPSNFSRLYVRVKPYPAVDMVVDMVGAF
jgi:hypothetical protein